MKAMFFKYFIISFILLMGKQNCLSSEYFNEESWWGIKCSELPGSFGHSVDKEVIFINLPNGITGCDKLIAKALVVHIKTPTEFVDNILSYPGLEVWAKEYYINSTNHKPHHNFITLLRSPIFTINDQDHSIHQALATCCQKSSLPQPEIYITNQKSSADQNTFQFTPEVNIIHQITGFFEVVKDDFRKKIFCDSNGILLETSDGKLSLWEISNSVKIQLLNGIFSCKLIACRNHDWCGKIVESISFGDFDKWFRKFIFQFNGFNETLIERTELSHGCHTISYKENCMKKGPIVPINNGSSILFIAKNPRTNDQITLLKDFLEKEESFLQKEYSKSSSVIDYIIDELSNRTEIMNVLALKIEPLCNYPKLNQDGFGISIGMTKDFAKARFNSSFGGSNKQMLRLEFFTKPVRNKKGGVAIDDF